MVVALEGGSSFVPSPVTDGHSQERDMSRCGASRRRTRTPIYFYGFALNRVRAKCSNA